MKDTDAGRLPPRVLGMICRMAEAKGLLRGRREAVLDRLEAMGSDLFGGDAGVFSGLFASAAGSSGSGPLPDPWEIGGLFWRTAHGDTETRRLEGTYYTPPAVIDRILDLVRDSLFPDGRLSASARSTVCDPAMGCGFFLLRIAERLLAVHPGNSGAVRKWARRCLYGIDKDPVSVFLARVLLWLTLSEPGKEFIPGPENLACGDALLGPAFGENAPEAAAMPGADWQAVFPAAAAAGGFAAVAGNPPYEVLTNFSRRPERRALADALRISGWYRDSLGGQINLYRCFIERSLAVLRPGGVLSMIVPLSLARDAAAAPLRRRLLGNESADRWILFGERDRVFSGVTQSACIFRAVKGGGPAETVRRETGNTESAVTLEELRSLSGGGLVIPALDGRGTELWSWMREHCPGSVGDLAEIRVGEADQTVYRDCMRDTDTGCLLVRGSHLTPFRLSLEPLPAKERYLDLPRFLERKGAAAAGCAARAGCRRVVQLGIRNMQSRPRLIAALAPPGVYCGNSLNVYFPREGYPLEYLAALLNSRLLDWLFRSFSGNNNINIHEIRRLPHPAEPKTEAMQAAAEAYADCAEAAGDAARLPECRRRMDAAVEAVYGLPDRFLPILEDGAGWV